MVTPHSYAGALSPLQRGRSRRASGPARPARRSVAEHVAGVGRCRGSIGGDQFVEAVEDLLAADVADQRDFERLRRKCPRRNRRDPGLERRALVVEHRLAVAGDAVEQAIAELARARHRRPAPGRSRWGWRHWRWGSRARGPAGRPSPRRPRGTSGSRAAGWRRRHRPRQRGADAGGGDVVVALVEHARGYRRRSRGAGRHACRKSGRAPALVAEVEIGADRDAAHVAAPRRGSG